MQNNGPFWDFIHSANWKLIAIYVGCAAYIGYQDVNNVRTWKGFFKLVSSASLSAGLSGDIAEYFGWPAAGVTVFILLFGVAFLNVVDGFFGDKERVIKLFLNLIGRSENNANADTDEK